ncbi:uncharacterized protein LOC128553648, partial [Mercenaria mercenaria]|uniref:uncharacterized protein LOC128553648 n=1 Tax=Mercenaria mercenaria TaxID=6596 RepID=UPI00234EFDF6
MSGESEIVSESVPSEDLVSGNGNDESLKQVVTDIVESILTEKLADFKKEINDSVQATINDSLSFRAQDASARQESILYSREENVHPKTDVARAATKEDLSYWKHRAEDELKSAKGTKLKNLNGAHTVICIDTSASMKGKEAWEQAKAFFTDYMTGIKEEYLQKRKHSNTALVTFGKKTKVQQRLTKDVKVLAQKI